MANIIKPKRSNTAGLVPTTSNLTSGELGVNMADKKVYINNGTSVVQVGAGNLSGLGDTNITSPTNGQSLQYDSATGKWINGTGGSGDVTGASSSTDNALVRFDGTTGKVIQNGTVTEDDNGNLGNVNGISFDTTPTNPPTATGSMYWDNGNGTPSIILDADVELQLGQENLVKVYNGTGSTITNGSVVAVSGAQGQRPSVVLADADSEPLSAGTLGIATESIANGAEGFVTTFGLVRGINTSAFTAGTPIYLSQTAGQFTATRPTAPAHTVFLGWVISVNASSGEVFVNISNGWELDELHNVLITSPASGNTLIYDAVAGVWENANITAGTGVSVTNGAGSITIANTGVTSAVAGTGISVSGATGAVTITNSDRGSSQNIFKNIAVSGQSTVVADSNDDTVTLANGTGVSITTNATTDTITITNTSPDQVVALTGGTGITTSGTYPNFTITNSGVTSFSAGTTGLTPSTGTTGAVTLAGTLAVANGGTGSTTASGARTNLGATTVGGNLFTLANPSAITFPRFNADNTVSALNATDFRTAIGAGTGNGTVTGVTATSPVASSGGTAPVISLSSGYGDTQNPYASKSANLFLASPNGTAGAPTFRSIVASDIPTLNQNTTGTASNVTGTVAIANGGTGATTASGALTNLGAYPATNPNGYTSNTGTVTSVSATAGTGISISGSPITTSGTLTITNTDTGSSQNIFKNIAVSGQTTIVADANDDTLTIANGTGISLTTNATTDTLTITNSAPDQVVSLTGSGATTVTGTYPNFTISSVNTTYSPATSTVAGLIELGSDTLQTTAPNAVTSTANRTYALQVNASGQGVLNVPWTDSGGTVTSITAGTGLSGGTITTSGTIALANTAVTAGSYTNANITVDAQGRITSASNGTSAGGTVTSVSGTGTVSGLTLTGTVTSSGSLTLGGNLSITADMIYDSFTATASQTTFTTSQTYTASKIEVFVNGVKMVNGADVTVSGGTSVVMAFALTAGDRVDLVYPI